VIVLYCSKLIWLPLFLLIYGTVSCCIVEYLIVACVQLYMSVEREPICTLLKLVYGWSLCHSQGNVRSRSTPRRQATVLILLYLMSLCVSLSHTLTLSHHHHHHHHHSHHHRYDCDGYSSWINRSMSFSRSVGTVTCPVLLIKNFPRKFHNGSLAPVFSKKYRQRTGVSGFVRKIGPNFIKIPG
jgi:hypothetical protein